MTEPVSKSRIPQDRDRIRRKRVEAGLEQRQLAAKAGISVQHMNSIEMGKRGASAPVLRRIAKALHCPVADLLPEVAASGNGDEAA